MKTQKILAAFLSCAIVAAVVSRNASAQNSSRPVDEARVARLAGLAKVWGAVKFFHPVLAYHDIDWDRALIETIPKVNAAKTPQEYQTAVNQMLAALHDKSTRAELEAETKSDAAKEPSGTDAKHVRTENGVLIIDAAGIAKTVTKETSALNRFVTNIDQALPGATAIIVDARSATKITDFESYFFNLFLRQALTSMLDTKAVLAAPRYRMHNGYASQTAGGAEFYYSAFVNATPQTIQGRSKTRTPPMAFIINQNSPSFAEALGGLQSASRALVIQDGEHAPEAGAGLFTIDLPEKIKVRMRTQELVSPNGSIDLQPDVVLPKTTPTDAAIKEAIALVRNKTGPAVSRAGSGVVSQIDQKDKPYADMEFPNAEYRLLALFRYWTVVNYFFPYKHLIGDSWATVLQRYIPKFEANANAADYQLTVRELVTEMRDSHGGVRNTNAASEKLGTFQPAVLVRYVEEKSVVTKVLDEKLPIKVGDTILTVDGEPVEKRREFLSRYIATSTPQWLMRGVHARLLIGPKDTTVKLSVRGLGGEVRDVELPRSILTTDPKLFAEGQRGTPIVQVLPSGYGYVDLARLQGAEVDKMFETIKNTPALIFDMRGYPNGTAWSIAPRLTDKGNVVAALFSRPLLEATTLSQSEYAESPSFSFSQKIPDRQGELYKGKVVMLINEDAISQAEHTCMFFEAATDVTFIGTPTAGANGDVTFMVLPGNLAVSFTGHNVRHADGRQLQRVGIQPNIRVAPTIRGLVDKRDEILEAAVKFLNESVKK